MNAIVLGGAVNKGALRESAGKYEASIRIHNIPMVEYVITALEKMKTIEQIILVAPEGLIDPAKRSKRLEFVPPGNTMVDSLLKGLDGLDSCQHVLVLTSDIPLITPEALEDFLYQCSLKEADIYYSFVPKEIIEDRYQGVNRTYVRLSDGVFTGGNVVLINPQVILSRRERILQAVQLRKHPVKLCRVLGSNFFIKLMVGRLTVAEIEERVGEILGFKGAGIISNYPEVGIDVDKPSDLELAKTILEKKESGLSCLG